MTGACHPREVCACSLQPSQQARAADSKVEIAGKALGAKQQQPQQRDSMKRKGEAINAGNVREVERSTANMGGVSGLGTQLSLVAGPAMQVPAVRHHETLAIS